jgi:hypothetical protein
MVGGDYRARSCLSDNSCIQIQLPLAFVNQFGGLVADEAHDILVNRMEYMHVLWRGKHNYSSKLWRSSIKWNFVGRS